MDEVSSMKALYESEIANLKEQIARLQEENRVLQANLNVGMGKNETNESLFGGPTPMEILQANAIKENTSYESENEKAFR